MHQLLKGDCKELLKTIPDKSVDMVLCDLPYGTTHNKWDIIIPFDLLWKQYNRIVKDNGAILLFAQGVFYCLLVNSNLKMFKYDLVWDKKLKSGFLNANRMPLRQHEQIAVFYKKLPTYNPQFSEGQPLHSKGSSYRYKEPINNNYGLYYNASNERAGSKQKYPSSILEYQKPHPSKALHPTEKSIELCEYLIKTYTNEGETVLDNSMGVGTTGIAAVKNNRNFIGIELNENYFKIAEQRIKEVENEIQI